MSDTPFICPGHPEQAPDIDAVVIKDKTVYYCSDKTFLKGSPCLKCPCRKMSNYEVTKRRTQKEFARYDHGAIAAKLDLIYDDEFMYLEFLGRDYRANRHSGVMEWKDEEGQLHEGDFNDVMTILDILCYSKEGAAPAGEYQVMHSLATLQGGTTFAGEGSFTRHEKLFDEHTEAFKQALEKIGGIPGGKGDVSRKIRIFKDLWVIVEFWRSDEDFPASLEFMADKKTLDYMHYETVWYMVGALIAQIREQMEKDGV